MEWWKLFSGTFVLIFLAELGDKTQLAALAKTADAPDNSMAKWVVFIGASGALVASTFIAVFLGHILQSIIPDMRYIKIAAGTLFLIFGFMVLYETYKSYLPSAEPEAAAAAATVTTVTPAGTNASARTFVGGLALKAAIDFESRASARYRELATNASGTLSSLMLELACEEDSHLARLRNMPEEAEGLACPIPMPRAKQGEPTTADKETLADLIRHEQASAEFYHALAERTMIPSAKAVFAKLAQDEKNHANRLADMAKTLA